MKDAPFSEDFEIFDSNVLHVADANLSMLTLMYGALHRLLRCQYGPVEIQRIASETLKQVHEIAAARAVVRPRGEVVPIKHLNLKKEIELVIEDSFKNDELKLNRR